MARPRGSPALIGSHIHAAEIPSPTITTHHTRWASSAGASREAVGENNVDREGAVSSITPKQASAPTRQKRYETVTMTLRTPSVPNACLRVTGPTRTGGEPESSDIVDPSPCRPAANSMGKQ